MNSRRNIEILRVAVAVGALLIAGFAQGETGTEGVYYQVEGEGSCNSFSPNDVGSLTVSPVSAIPDTVASDGMLNLKYTLEATGLASELSWSTVPPSEAVNAVILVGTKIQGKQKSLIYHFGANGATSDSGEVGPSEGLSKVTFCYGIDPLFEPPPPPPPPEPEPIAVCTDANGEELNGTGITCPNPDEDDNKRFVFTVNPYGQNGEIAVCTCNFGTEHALKVCDPSLPAGEEGGCLPHPDQLCVIDPETQQEVCENPKGLNWVPAEIMIFQNGTGFCWTTLSGGRQCAN